MKRGSKSKLRIWSKASERNGFALLVTISLMVLLTIGALGMLSLSAIELRSSGASVHPQKTNS
jgi:Tfp pilus assembly protein PilV